MRSSANLSIKNESRKAILGNNKDTELGGDVNDIEDRETEIQEAHKTDELEGAPGRNPDKDGLASTVMESQEDSVELGGAVLDSMNNGSGPFTPELMMEQFVQDFRQAEKLYGETLIRKLTGYDADYVQKNMNIPEFKRHLEERVKQNIEELKEQGFMDREGSFTEEAVELAALSLAVRELDHLQASGHTGPRKHDKRVNAPGHDETRKFAGEPYKQISIHQSVKTALRRGRNSLQKNDLRVFEPSAHGRVEIIYAVDTSGSMKGAKIAAAKRAGVALAYEGIESGDKVGLVAFGKDIERSIAPCKNFSDILQSLTRVKAGSETDLAVGIQKACSLFATRGSESKHVILLTDALPTVGSHPTQDVLEAVGIARADNITVSVVGIGLDSDGEELARSIADVGHGRVLVCNDIQNLDKIILSEYMSSRHA
jgi:Mg-chelatase subunit ChlD